MSVLFVQKDVNGLSRGTAVEAATPTTAHVQAAAMVKSSVGFCVKPLGSHDVVVVDRSDVDPMHPDDPRLTSAAQICSSAILVDRLPDGQKVRLSVNKVNWPRCELMIVVDDRHIGDSYILDEIAMAIDKASRTGIVDSNFGDPIKIALNRDYITDDAIMMALSRRLKVMKK